MVLLCETKLSFLNHWSYFLLYSFSMYFWSINMIWDWHISWLFLFSFRYTSICLLFEKTYMKVKGYNKIQLFAQEFIHIFDDIISYCFYYLCKFYTISKLKRMNDTFFLCILLIISAKVTLNPGPVYSNQWKEKNLFKSKGIHLINVNINGLPSKIYEIRYIAGTLMPQ